MELSERGKVTRDKRKRTLTSSHCGSCDGVFFTPSSSSSDIGSDSDGVLSSLLQTSQCVHSLTSSKAI